MFIVPLNRSLPPVDRDHRREDVHAGGEAFIDERRGKAERIRLGTDRREDDPGVEVVGWGHVFVVLSDRICY